MAGNVEVKFKRGDKVRVVDNSKLTDYQIVRIGRKGTVLKSNTNPFVQFKDGAKEPYNQDKLKLCKPKRIPFDLERALAGDELVTRGGERATKFKLDLSRHKPEPYEYKAIVRGYPVDYTENGRYWRDEQKSEDDLFMKHPAKKPVKFTPEFVDAFNKLKLPLQDCDKLKGAFLDLLEMYAPRYENFGTEAGSQHFHVIKNWKEKAGLL